MDQINARKIAKPYPGELEEAKKHPDGWVYRIAGSFRENEAVPPEAIVGAWRVNRSGEIIGDFILNPNYDPTEHP